jgi:hypothetical protein
MPTIEYKELGPAYVTALLKDFKIMLNRWTQIYLTLDGITTLQISTEMPGNNVLFSYFPQRNRTQMFCF